MLVFTLDKSRLAVGLFLWYQSSLPSLNRRANELKMPNYSFKVLRPKKRPELFLVVAVIPLNSEWRGLALSARNEEANLYKNGMKIKTSKGIMDLGN